MKFILKSTTFQITARADEDVSDDPRLHRLNGSIGEFIVLPIAKRRIEYAPCQCGPHFTAGNVCCYQQAK